MNLDLDYLLTFLVYGLRYLPNTLYMTFLSLAFGVILVGLIAIVRTYKVKVLDPVLTALLAILKAIPTNLIMVMSSIIFTANFARVTEAWGIDMSLRDDLSCCIRTHPVGDRIAVGINKRSSDVSSQDAV